MDYRFDKTANKPLYVAGVNHINALVEDGQLPLGSSLPSIREYARINGISPNTAQKIFAELEKTGVIETTPGQGSTVAFSQREANRSGLVRVFWSYAHKDNTNSHGAIDTLLNSICCEYELATGDSLDVFVDKENIAWGDNWKSIIDDAVQHTTFFIPVLTPTYLNRPNCLSELKTAIRRFEEIGMQAGIYPIRFVNIDRALKNHVDKKLAKFLSETQGINFFEIETRNPDDQSYQGIVRKIVSDLIKIDDELYENREQIEKRACDSDKTLNNQSNTKNTEPGYLDRLAGMEKKTQEQSEILEALTSNMQRIGELTKKKQAEIKVSDAQRRGFPGRLEIVREMAKELKPLALSLNKQCAVFTENTSIMTDGIEAYVALAQNDGDNRSETFENSIHTLVSESDFTFSNCRSFFNTLESVGKMSRDLREPFGTMQSGIALFCSNEEAFKYWDRCIDALD